MSERHMGKHFVIKPAKHVGKKAWQTFGSHAAQPGMHVSVKHLAKNCIHVLQIAIWVREIPTCTWKSLRQFAKVDCKNNTSTAWKIISQHSVIRLPKLNA